MMQFQQNRLGGNPTAPSLGGIAQLNRQGMQSANQLAEVLGNIGKIQRTQKVNDLIARGGLNGLSEQEAQAKMIGIADGSITKDGQAGVDTLLGAKRGIDKGQRLDNRQTNNQTFVNTQRLAKNKEATNVAKLYQTNKINNIGLQNTNKLNQQKVARDAQGKNTFQLIKGANGNIWREQKNGTFKDTGTAFDKTSGKGGGSYKKSQDPISQMGMSKVAEPHFRELSIDQQKQLMNDNGKLKSGVSWVRVPAVIRNGKTIKKESGYFFDKKANRKIMIDKLPKAIKPKESSWSLW